MPENFPGPYTLDFTYTVSGIQHLMSTNLSMSVVADIGDPFADWSIANRSALPVTLEAWSDGLIALLRPFFFTGVTFDTATLFSVAPLSFDKVWQSEETIGLAGTEVTTPDLSKQRIFTMRSVEGGVAKLVLMEGSQILDDQRGPAAYGPAELALTAYLISADAATLARDTSFLIANIRVSDGQNEQTWRQRNR